MEQKETLSIIKMVITYYPNIKMEDPKLTLDAWHAVLKDYEWNMIVKNLVDYVKSGEKFPPSVGQLLPRKEFNGPYVPNAEETQERFKEQERMALETQKALQDPAMQENIAKIKADIRRMLETKRNEG